MEFAALIYETWVIKENSRRICDIELVRKYEKYMKVNDQDVQIFSDVKGIIQQDCNLRMLNLLLQKCNPSGNKDILQEIQEKDRSYATYDTPITKYPRTQINHPSPIL